LTVVPTEKTVESGQTEGILPSIVLSASVCFYFFDTTGQPDPEDQPMPRSTTKFTKRYIDSLTCQPGKAASFYWDSEVKGFGVRITRSGTKSYILQRYVGGGKQISRATIGYTTVLALEEARQRAIAEIATYYSRGLDPRVERKKQAAVAQVRGFTLRSALEEYLANRPKTRASTKEGYHDSIERYCADWLDLPLAEISTDMVLARHTDIQVKIAKRARAANAVGLTSANKTMRAVRAVWNYALAAERIPLATTNPVAKFARLGKWYPERQRSEFITSTDITPFYQAVDVLQNRPAATYFKLLLFTGLRDHEARALQWQYVDFADAMIRLPHEQTKANRHLDLPMSDFVHELLLRWKAESVSEYVFPGEIRKTYMAWPSDSLDKIQTATGLAFLTPHVLRHTFRTHAKLIGIPDSTASELLNHSKGGSITARYDHTGADVLREPMQRITNHFKTLVGLPVLTPAPAQSSEQPSDMEAAITMAMKLGKDREAARAFFQAA
jgi:integrase